MKWKINKLFTKIVNLFKYKFKNLTIINSEDFFSIDIAVLIAKYVFCKIKNFSYSNIKICKCKECKKNKQNILILTTKTIFNNFDFKKKAITFKKFVRNNFICRKYIKLFIENYKKKKLVVIFNNIDSSFSGISINNKNWKIIFMKNSNTNFESGLKLKLLSKNYKDILFYENCYLPEIFKIDKKNKFLKDNIINFFINKKFIKNFQNIKYYYILINLEKIIMHFCLKNHGGKGIFFIENKKIPIKKIFSIFNYLIFLYKKKNIKCFPLIYEIRKNI